MPGFRRFARFTWQSSGSLTPWLSSRCSGAGPRARAGHPSSACLPGTVHADQWICPLSEQVKGLLGLQDDLHCETGNEDSHEHGVSNA